MSFFVDNVEVRRSKALAHVIDALGIEAHARWAAWFNLACEDSEDGRIARQALAAQTPVRIELPNPACAGTPVPDDPDSDGEHTFNANGACIDCGCQRQKGLRRS